MRTTGNWFFYVLFCASLALTWFFHKDATRFSDRHELWSDRAGYYIYLPATFFYHFDARRMPPDLDVKTGGGFAIDTLHNKIDTKYTCGVALLNAPFFIASGLVSRIAGYDSESGFSMIYMRMMGLAAVVYLMLGLWFLKKFLDNYFQPAVSLLAITLIFVGTNLFYYALIDGMMSHVYSFFLFALFLFAMKKYLDSHGYPFFILLSMTLSLAILIRPTNILLGVLFFTWEASTPAGWLKRIRNFLEPSQIVAFMVILFIIFAPQMIYWKYLSGHWLHFSYGNEGFTNWRHPKIAEVLFSPVNGLFTCTPMAIICLAGSGIMMFQKRSNGWLVAAIFLVVTLVCASWKMWYFGCSFGQRSFIEYYTILSVPLAWLITVLFNNRFFLVKTFMLFVIFLMVYASLRYTVVLYRFDRCYFGSTWDWDHYWRTIERAGIVSPVGRITSYSNDFENLALSPVAHPSMIFTRSGQYSIANEKSGQTPLFSIMLDELGYPFPKKMEVEVWVFTPGSRPTGASMDYTLSKGAQVLFSDKQQLDNVVKKPLTWSKVSKTFIIPDVNDSSLQISIFMHQPGQALLFIDDLKVRYHYTWN